MPDRAVRYPRDANQLGSENLGKLQWPWGRSAEPYRQYLRTAVFVIASVAAVFWIVGTSKIFGECIKQSENDQRYGALQQGGPLVLDANRYLGGRTSVDGVAGNNYESALRYGLTLSVPLGQGFSAKASWGSFLTARNGGAFDRIGITLQYRWFDR